VPVNLHLGRIQVVWDDPEALDGASGPPDAPFLPAYRTERQNGQRRLTFSAGSGVTPVTVEAPDLCHLKPAEMVGLGRGSWTQR
jgi:hypothetical protein